LKTSGTYTPPGAKSWGVILLSLKGTSEKGTSEKGISEKDTSEKGNWK